MAMDFDSQLIESVEVRRQRLSASFLFGLNPTERRWKDRTNLFVFGLILAALICAFCVGISFVVNIIGNWLAEREARNQPQQQSRGLDQQRDILLPPTPTQPAAPPAASPADSTVLAALPPATLPTTQPTTQPPTPWRS
ncbi:hypothetical protein AB0K08_03620 [Citricoccus sp. NPDC055426]|uniref:hypothetical protein n=1 Tax=Citricoccus sp. NPDC055426 TaxID=3155536 RepID=UPI00342E083C